MYNRLVFFSTPFLHMAAATTAANMATSALGLIAQFSWWIINKIYHLPAGRPGQALIERSNKWAEKERALAVVIEICAIERKARERSYFKLQDDALSFERNDNKLYSSKDNIIFISIMSVWQIKAWSMNLTVIRLIVSQLDSARLELLYYYYSWQRMGVSSASTSLIRLI